MMVYYEDLMKKFDEAGMPEETINNSKLFSDQVADAVLAWSKKDNYAQTRSASKYTVTDEDGRWVPTPPMYASAVEAHWMEDTGRWSLIRQVNAWLSVRRSTI